MLIVTGTFNVHADDLPAILPAARAMAQATRAEEGCIAYAFYQDIETPERFRVYEEWRDQAALDEHFRSAHMAEFRVVQQTVRVTDRDFTIYEAGAAKKF